jgi:hypothetical protein
MGKAVRIFLGVGPKSWTAQQALSRSLAFVDFFADRHGSNWSLAPALRRAIRSSRILRCFSASDASINSETCNSIRHRLNIMFVSWVLKWILWVAG